eukprot:6208146-Pyramimonas_sp.AAC.1
MSERMSERECVYRTTLTSKQGHSERSEKKGMVQVGMVQIGQLVRSRHARNSCHPLNPSPGVDCQPMAVRRQGIYVEYSVEYSK